RSQHRHRRRSHRPVVQIDLIRRNQKLFAQLAPVSLFIRTVKRAVRQFRRLLFKQHPPPRRKPQHSRRPCSARERRQKPTPIDHDFLHRTSCANSTRELHPQQPTFEHTMLAATRASVYLVEASLRFERSGNMRYSKWIVAAIFVFSICGSNNLLSQEKPPAKPA